jgi:hypothetical protein
VTRHRDEDYPCKKPVQVPYDAIVAKYTSDIMINFASEMENIEIPFMLQMMTNGASNLTIKEENAQTPIVLLEKEDLDSQDGDDDQVDIQQSFDLKIVDKTEFLGPLANGFKQVKLLRKSQELLFSLESKIDAKKFNLGVVINLGEDLVVDQLINLDHEAVTIENNKSDDSEEADSTIVKIDLKKLELKEEIKKKTYDVRLSLFLIFDGIMLNQQRPQLEITQEFKVKASRK